MKIDDYIRHLELQRKGLKEKYNKLQGASDKTFFVNRLDPNFGAIKETRVKVREVNDKLTFLRNLRKEIMNYEVQNQTNRKR